MNQLKHNVFDKTTQALRKKYLADFLLCSLEFIAETFQCVST